MAARPSKKRRDEDPEVDDSKTKEEKLMTENTRQRQTIRDLTDELTRERAIIDGLERENARSKRIQRENDRLRKKVADLKESLKNETALKQSALSDLEKANKIVNAWLNAYNAAMAPIDFVSGSDDSSSDSD